MKRLFIFISLALTALGCARQAEQPQGTDLRSTVVYELNTRQFTPEGSFTAAAAHLPRLKETGVDIVWVMPLYPIGEKHRKGSLGSYYAIKDDCATNPEFGTLEDFDAFVKAAHDCGLKVIIDWVANHTSPDCAWVTEKPADWYVRDEEGNTIVEYDWDDIAKLNYENADMRAEMKRCMDFWLQRGIDGFRCDVAYQIPQDFWTEVIADFRARYPRQLYFLAEGEETWLHEAGFDATYSWKLHHLLNDIAQGNAGMEELVEYIKWNDETYPDDAMRLAFTSNHDENSWSGTEFERMGDAWKAMTVLCWTLPQTQPLIYTAQEMGYDHRFQFFEKDAVPEWKENGYTDFYRYLTEIKHSHPALQAGNGSYSIVSADCSTLVFDRSCEGDSVRVSVQLQAPWAWSITTEADRVERLEPLCWWTGMKTPLQLLIKGEGISEYDVKVEGGKGVSISSVEKAESPNYLFANVKIAADAAPGTYQLVFSKGKDSFKVPYEILERREGSAERGSFTTKDLIYLIMPDRFADGDSRIDNTPETAETADRDCLWGRHGGDIQGIMDHLDYLEELGVTAIWNTPLLLDNEPESSYHGYACGDYYHIDPRFGSNEMYRRLVDEAHGHGIKMIMDIVTNHCGSAHWWMQDLPFSDWIHQWPEYTHSNCAFSMQNDAHASAADRNNMESGWFDTSMPDMNLDNSYLLQYFKQYAIWWIEWADLDGLRVDTYPYNEKVPMSEWCKAVRGEFPNINIVGEVWTTNIAQLAYWQDGALNRDGFNSNLPCIMDFPLHDALCQGVPCDYVNWSEGLVKVFDAISNDTYYADPQNILIFCSNHDTDRVGDVVRKDPRRQKIMLALTATLRGIPQIFSGDEMMFVTKKGWHRDGALRVDFPGGWKGDEFDLFTPEGRQQCNVDMSGESIAPGTYADVHDYAATLFNWRKGSKAVQEGETMHFLRRDNTYAYFRYTDDETVFVFVNNSPSEVRIPWAEYGEFTGRLAAQGRDIISGEMVDPSNYNVPAETALILEYK